MKYQYRPLLRVEDEIRLILLLPGDSDGPIRISIFHTLLTPSVVAQGKNGERGRREIMVPYPWSAEETSGGDALYLNKNTNETSWTHPSGNPALPATEVPDFQPHYEALSYTWGPSQDSENAYVVDSGADGNEECTTLVIYPKPSLCLSSSPPHRPGSHILGRCDMHQPRGHRRTKQVGQADGKRIQTGVSGRGLAG
jgi:hypothetical protein